MTKILALEIYVKIVIMNEDLENYAFMTIGSFIFFKVLPMNYSINIK